MPNPITIRPAGDADVPIIGALGAMLMREHYSFDPKRFMKPPDNVERGYGSFLRSQMRNEEAVVLVAESDQGEVMGYVFAALEPTSWKELREAAGFIHDIVVAEQSRGKGVASALLGAAFDWLRSRGAPRVVLMTAEPNHDAQRVFTRLGFRRTMIEMTREL